MNLIQIERKLKVLSDEQLHQEMANGVIPSYLALAEFQQRRDTKMKEGAGKPESPPLSEKIPAEVMGDMGIVSAKQEPQGMPDTAGMPNPQVPMQQQEAPQQQGPQPLGMAAGGIVAFNTGGDIYGQDDIVNRMMPSLVNTESRGRHIDPATGQLLQSPAGAQGITQVMPTTGVKPGFGIAPIQNNSQEEYMRFGKDYLSAMVKRYGDPAKAAAAYNTGPGNVDKALKKEQETGNPWISFLPKETQQYVAKVAQSEDGPIKLPFGVKSDKSLLERLSPFGSAEAGIMVGAADKNFPSHYRNQVGPGSTLSPSALSRDQGIYSGHTGQRSSGRISTAPISILGTEKNQGSFSANEPDETARGPASIYSDSGKDIGIKSVGEPMKDIQRTLAQGLFDESDRQQRRREGLVEELKLAHDPAARQKLLDDEEGLSDRQRAKLEKYLPDTNAPIAEKIAKMQKENESGKSKDGYTSLLQMGLSMMGTDVTTPGLSGLFKSVGKSGGTALESYNKMEESRKRRDEALLGMQASLASAQEARNRGMYDMAEKSAARITDRKLAAQKEDEAFKVHAIDAGLKAINPELPLQKINAMAAITNANNPTQSKLVQEFVESESQRTGKPKEYFLGMALGLYISPATAEANLEKTMLAERAKRQQNGEDINDAKYIEFERETINRFREYAAKARSAQAQGIEYDPKKRDLIGIQ